MQEIYVQNIKEIIRTKTKLEKELGVKITNKGRIFFIDGTPENEFLALEVVEGIKLGFSADRALELKQEDFIIQKINIKNITRRNDLERIRARLIGTKGKTLKTLRNLTNCDFSITNNEIGIIGPIDEIEEALQSVTSLVQGSKQGNVYSRLEKNGKIKRKENLNLK
ncbi:MAG: KH domain-containing protein [Nanoarchaeota archaeon]